MRTPLTFDEAFDRKPRSDRGNLSGQQFTYITVISEASPQREPRGSLKRYWNCLCKCGKELVIKGDNLRGGGTKSCGCWRTEQSRQRSGVNSPAWTGGVMRSRPDGYVAVMQKGHQRANQNGYVLEHLLVMEKKLGRPLIAGETVHHKNGVRADNRPENLELWCSNHPTGQRVEDLVKWAQEILKRYGN